jgi:hypothetical protein
MDEDEAEAGAADARLGGMTEKGERRRRDGH